MIAAVAFSAVASCGRATPAVSDPTSGETVSTTSPSIPPKPAPSAAISAGGGSTSSPPSARPPSDLYSPEATACRATADCERVPLRAEVELNGGPCCTVCTGYAAVNHAYQARQPVCDPAKRGACPVSCMEARPPPVACEAGQCVLTYPPLQATCASDSDCVVVPSLLPNAPAGGCRVACGAYTAGNRDWDAWASGLWQNPGVTGVCPEGCVDPMLPAAACVAGQCGIRAKAVVRVTRVDLRVPTVTGPLTSAAVASVVTASLAQLTSCKERPRSLAPIGYAGFQVHFIVGADGRTAEIDPGELRNHLPDIAVCMVAVIRGLQFPRSAGAGTSSVEYPMGAAFETK